DRDLRRVRRVGRPRGPAPGGAAGRPLGARHPDPGPGPLAAAAGHDRCRPHDLRHHVDPGHHRAALPPGPAGAAGPGGGRPPSAVPATLKPGAGPGFSVAVSAPGQPRRRRARRQRRREPIPCDSRPPASSHRARAPRATPPVRASAGAAALAVVAGARFTVSPSTCTPRVTLTGEPLATTAPVAGLWASTLPTSAGLLVGRLSVVSTQPAASTLARAADSVRPIRSGTVQVAVPVGAVPAAADTARGGAMVTSTLVPVGSWFPAGGFWPTILPASAGFPGGPVVTVPSWQPAAVRIAGAASGRRPLRLGTRQRLTAGPVTVASPLTGMSA